MTSLKLALGDYELISQYPSHLITPSISPSAHFHVMWFLIFALVTANAQAQAKPCSIDSLSDAWTSIRCRHATIDNVAKAVGNSADSLAINVSVIEVFESDIPSLPNLFASLTSTLERIRVANSLVHFVAGNAFTGLEDQLKILDLSGNKLESVPTAVQQLKRLEVLDLRDNSIRVVSGLRVNLRHLYVSHNLLGWSEGGNGAGGLNPVPKTTPRLSIGTDVLDLSDAAATLQHLDISYNGLHVLPDQLRSTSGDEDIFLPRLDTLMLVGNRLSDVTTIPPTLQTLSLDSNLIRTLKSSAVGQHLKILTLLDNPLQCDCNIMWLLEWIRQKPNLTLRLPPCTTPFYLRDLSLAHLNDQRLCPSTPNQDTQVVYVTDRDLASFHLGLFQSLHLLDVRGEVDALFVTWKVDPEFYVSNFEWSIILRRFDSDIYHFNLTHFTQANYQKHEDAQGGIYSDSVRGIPAPYIYLLCVAAVDGNVHYVHLNHCKGAMTLQESQQPSVIVTTGSTVSASTETTPGVQNTQLLFDVHGEGKRRSIRLNWTIYRVDESPEAVSHAPLNLDALFKLPKYQWKIQVRRFGALMPQKSIDMSTSNRSAVTLVEDLDAGSEYIACLRLQKSEVQDEKCVEVTTTPNRTSFGSGQMAAAAAVAAVVASVLTALITYCCCRRKQKRKHRQKRPIQLPKETIQLPKETMQLPKETTQ